MIPPRASLRSAIAAQVGPGSCARSGAARQNAAVKSHGATRSGLACNGMVRDFSWERSARGYEELYRRAMARV